MGIMDHLFGKKRLEEPADLSVLQTDMHSHLIPGIDDGVPDVETSVKLIEQMASLGYRKLITTPHIMVDIYQNNPQIISDGLQQVKQALHKAEITMELQVAAEYQLDEGFRDLLNRNELMTFGQNHILVELPYFSPPPNLADILFDLQVSGYKVILAHPERYAYWHTDFSVLEDLHGRDILFQINTISLTGFYSKPTKKLCEKLIDARMVDFLGSDLHNIQYFRLLEDVRYEPYLAKVLASGDVKNHML